jgi:hypothetical protein
VFEAADSLFQQLGRPPMAGGEGLWGVGILLSLVGPLGIPLAHMLFRVGLPAAWTSVIGVWVVWTFGLGAAIALSGPYK